MKKILLILILILPLINVYAQDSVAVENCKAYFKYEKKDMLMSPLPSMAVQFYDVSERPADSWYWDFGDGQTSREQNPMHVYIAENINADGSFYPYRLVQFTIMTIDSCVSTYTDTIQVFGNQTDPVSECRAYFEYYYTNYDSSNNTVTLQFKGIVENDSLQFNWNFGNGETSAEQSPEIIFDLSTNEYMVCLEVSGKNDCTSSYCEPVIIKNPYQPGVDSTECFSGFYYTVNYDVQSFAPALVLDFYSLSKNAVEWTWDFGDGTISNEENPMHIFNLPLDYDSDGNVPDLFRNVCLTIKTESGCESTLCQMIYLNLNDTIYPEPKPGCHAWFKYYQPNDIFSIPELIQYRFVDASEGDVLSRLWEFEDGTTSTLEVVDKGFDFMKQTQKVCLTVETADSCISTWCETIFVSNIPPDAVFIPTPTSEYYFKYEAYFPVWMSSCAGTVKAWVYQNDSLVEASNFVWSNGAEGQEAGGFCPTQTYSVKAITANGTVVSGTFVFNSDGTVTEIPVNWWISDSGDLIYISTSKIDQHYNIHWTLCDGTTFVGDSIPLNMINCGGAESNMFLTDSMGNVIYSENISLKAIATYANSTKLEKNVVLYPNPVNDVLNIIYNGEAIRKMYVEICDITGKRMLAKLFHDVQNGQKISLDTQMLTKGIYISRISSENHILSEQKILK